MTSQMLAQHSILTYHVQSVSMRSPVGSNDCLSSAKILDNFSIAPNGLEESWSSPRSQIGLFGLKGSSNELIGLHDGIQRTLVRGWARSWTWARAWSWRWSWAIILQVYAVAHDLVSIHWFCSLAYEPFIIRMSWHIGSKVCWEFIAVAGPPLKPPSFWNLTTMAEF
jgi:hypothetical protein